MKKHRPRKRPKRLKTRQDRQDRQLLRKAVRETFPGSREAFDGDDEEAWDPEWALPDPVLPPPPEIADVPAGVSERGAERPAGGREGRVVALWSGACGVEVGGERVDAVLPSRLAWDQQSAVAIGDRVVIVREDGAERVERVLERRTTLARPDPQNPRLERVLAANVDVVVLVSSVVRPALRPALIDRTLIAVERGGAESLVTVNKVDLLADPEARRHALAPLDPYRRLGIRVVECSVVSGEGLDALRAELAGRTAVFVGHSGVGKSSLVNALAGAEQARTGEVGETRGRHTTTRSRLYRLGDFEVIDTPGIRELGLADLSPEELRFYFPDFDEAAGECRFADCRHTHEPRCGVRAAVEAGRLSAQRFATYLRILESLSRSP